MRKLMLWLSLRRIERRVMREFDRQTRSGS